MGRLADYVTVLAVGSDQDAVVADRGGVLRLMGYSIHETGGSGGSAYEVAIVDGATASGGTEVAHVESTAKTAKSEWYGPDGVAMKSQAISVDVISGDVDVTVYFKRD